MERDVRSLNRIIEEFRLLKGISRDEFGKMIGTSGTTVKNIEEKESSIKAKYLIEMSKKFGEEINFDSWIREAAGILENRVNEPTNHYLPDKNVSLAETENQLKKILIDLDETFENPQTKIEIAQLMLNMVREQKKKLGDHDS